MTDTRSRKQTETSGRVRRYAFLGAVILALGFLALLVFSFPPMLTIPVTGWLPDAAFERFVQVFVDEENIAIHRMHALGFSFIVWIALIGLLTQLRKPDRSQAPLWAAAVMVTVSVIIDATIGIFDPFLLVLVGLVLAAIALHSQRLPEGGPSFLTRSGKTVAAISALAAIAYAYEEGRAQMLGPIEDPHVEFGHYAAMATLGVAIAASALLGASNLSGRRVTAWVTGAIVILMGGFFVGFPHAASSRGVGWGFATIILGAAYLFFALRSHSIET